MHQDLFTCSPSSHIRPQRTVSRLLLPQNVAASLRTFFYYYYLINIDCWMWLQTPSTKLLYLKHSRWLCDSESRDIHTGYHVFLWTHWLSCIPVKIPDTMYSCEHTGYHVFRWTYQIPCITMNTLTTMYFCEHAGYQVLLWTHWLLCIPVNILATMHSVSTADTMYS